MNYSPKQYFEMLEKDCKNANRKDINTRQSCAVCEDNAKGKIHKQALQALRTFQDLCGSKLRFARNRLGVVIRTNNKKADVDNLSKSILDSLNGIAYEDDKQCDVIICYRNGSEHILRRMINDLKKELK